MKLTLIVSLLSFASVASVASVASSAEAPGGPGTWGSWARPDKQAYGTTLTRPVWFTLTNGTLTEVAFPTVDLVQTRDSYLAIRELNKKSGGVVDERSHCSHKITREAGTLAFKVNTECAGISMQKRFAAATAFDGIEIEYSIRFSTPGKRQLLFIHNPSAANTSGGDGMQVLTSNGEPTLMAAQVDVRGDEPRALHVYSTQAVSWSLPASEGIVGFEGVNSPADLLNSRYFTNAYTSAQYGNVAGALTATTSKQNLTFKVILSFSDSRMTRFASLRAAALAAPMRASISYQRSEWAQYLSTLKYDRSDSLAEGSILILQALRDKANPGALIAAPANPWVPWYIEAPDHSYEESRKRHGDSNMGYRRVWPRDLYHKAMSFLSVGDTEAPREVLNWFKMVQLKDGSWSQNMWSDGTPSWQAFQIDETAFPIVLVRRLAELREISYTSYRAMVRRAATVLVQRGPETGQERWEENGGLSPNSMAAAVQGLLAAAWLEELEGGDKKLAARYRTVASGWMQKMKSWLVINDGYYGSNYIARMEVSHNGKWDPTHHAEIMIQNKGDHQQKMFREDQILDGGFLEFIISGLVKSDSTFTNTLRLYDQNVRKQTSAGLGYIRYTEDAYGENHVGGAWPLLSAERAIAAIELGDKNVSKHVDLMKDLSSKADVMCEQDTLSVCPLGWSHAAYLILQRSIADGRSFYIPLSER